ncbi:MAG: type III secretion system export apparatus subunit SctV [Geminicoccaceae bacterium]|nr:type III secretion system export apparatus subunit SctV [Geminicoccaceae bacterium]
MNLDRKAMMRILGLVAERQDLLLVALLVLAIFMMILPLPTVLVDVLIAVNLGMTIMMLMVSVYLRDPLSFSTLPSVILLLTVFRLSLSITTTRLILVQADAGRIVETFGNFVVAGNLVVGLVVFLIITIVQFVVITKGAERIAEVSARFSLDALPGKQMSIDSDLRSGMVDVAEARRRRNHLQKESQLYGAMDGAMKFVKGDAIAGLIIIAVNLIGGVAVGTLQNGMAVSDALHVYALLTVGDGLIAQIPALFVSITSGTIVTRVVSEDSRNLGIDISSQMIAEPKTLRLAGLVMALFAFVPGFPAAIFLFLGALLGGTGLLFYWRDLRKTRAEANLTAHLISAPQDAPRPAETVLRPPSIAVSMHVGGDLRDIVDPARFDADLEQIRHAVFEDLGIVLPSATLEFDRRLPERGWSVVMESVPIGEGDLDPDKLWIRDEEDHLAIADIPFDRERGIVPGQAVLLVERQWQGQLDELGIAYMAPTSTIVWLLARAMMRYASEFIGIHETRNILASLEPFHGELVKEAQRVVPLRKIAEILRRLVAEGVSIRNMRPVLEALVDWGQREQDVALLSEYVRGALKRQICFRHVDAQRLMPVLMLDSQVEETVRKAVRHTSVGSYLTLDQDTSQRLVDRIREEVGDMSGLAKRPVVVTAFDVRRFVHSLFETSGLEMAVLSYQELTPEITVQPVATIAV